METSTNKASLKMREEAIEARIFYRNELADECNVRKYFKIFPGQTDYHLFSKISPPIATNIINKITSLCFSKVLVDIGTDGVGLFDTYKYQNIFRNLLLNSLVDGDVLAVLGSDNTITTWGADFIYINGEGDYGIEYIEDTITGIARPVLTPKFTLKSTERYINIPINSISIGNTVHGLGFTPAVLFKNIDEENGIGVSYIERFNDLQVEYANSLTQIGKNLRIFQNLWVTNRDHSNPEYPITLNPGRINFLGEGGTLEQVENKYSSDENIKFIRILEEQMAEVSQVPKFLSGIEDVSKIPSGVALLIATQPMRELLGRIRENFKTTMTELVTKLMSISGVTTEPIIDFVVEDISQNKNDEINRALSLLQQGVISMEDAQKIIKPIVGLE